MKSSKYVGWILILCTAGCQNVSLKSLTSLEMFRPKTDKAEDNDDDFQTAVHTPLVGDKTTIAGLGMIVLEGVGLVTGLNGTGHDPPPSSYRTQMLKTMRKRNIAQPNMILKSPSTALVIVRAYLPPLVDKGDRFDIEVRVVPGSETTSLNGGWLMETYLSERALVPGRGLLKGHVFAKAEGPVLVSTSDGDLESKAGVLRQGRVLGGGVNIRKARHLALYLRNDFKGTRTVERVTNAIGKRFYSYNKFGVRESLAVAKTDQKIELKILRKYKDNYPRYLQVIRKIPYREREVARRVRLERLRDELNTPANAEQAALELEAIGPKAIPILKSGLKNPQLEVRFHAATALAYLDQPDGLKTLAEAARKERAFRVFALAAMAAVDDAQAHFLLRDLMNETSAETRYGAFRSLTTLDKHDPAVRGVHLNDQFMLHLVDSSGPPMIHLTNRQKAEIVLFGRGQRFRTPMFVRAGNHIMVRAAEGTQTVTVSRIELGRPDRKKVVSTRVADVILAVAELDASYPDVVQLLAQADRQHNLPSRIHIDALPRAGRIYYRPQPDGIPGRKTKTHIGSTNLAPNLFMPPRDDRTKRGSVSRSRTKHSSDDNPEDPSSRAETTSSETSPSDADRSRPKKRFRFFSSGRGLPDQHEPKDNNTQ